MDMLTPSQSQPPSVSIQTPKTSSQAGGTPVFVPLLNSKEGQWELDLTALEQAVSSPKARVLVLNR